LTDTAMTQMLDFGYRNHRCMHTDLTRRVIAEQFYFSKYLIHLKIRSRFVGLVTVVHVIDDSRR